MSLLIHGNEPYLINKKVQEYSNIEYPEFNLNKITLFGESEIDICNQLPFSAEKKVVILTPSEKFDNSLLLKYLKNETTSTELLVVLPSVDKRTNLYKHFQKKNSLICLNKLTEKELLNFITCYIGNKMNSATMQHLINRIDYFHNENSTLYDVVNSLDKLMLYTDEQLSDEVIDLLIEKSISTNIFALIGHILKGDRKQAQSLFSDLLINNAAIALISLLLSNFRQLYKIKLVAEANGTINLGISPYAYASLNQYNISAIEAERCIRLCNEIIQGIKEGKLSECLACDLLLAETFELLTI